MTGGMSEGFVFSELTAEDLSDVSEAENVCFSDPWSRQALEYLLPRQAMYSVVCREAESGRLAAYAGLGYVYDEGEIVNIAVVPAYRRRGLAREMLDKLYAFCRENGVGKVYLEVREHNSAARALYASAGFCEYGKRKKYYSNPTEDAVLMVHDLNGGGQL